jgi:hypothetical protein
VHPACGTGSVFLSVVEVLSEVMEQMTKACKKSFSTFNITYRFARQPCKTYVMTFYHLVYTKLNKAAIMRQQASKVSRGHSLKNTM